MSGVSYRIRDVVVEIPHGRLVRIKEDHSFQGVLADGRTWDGVIYSPYGATPAPIAEAIEDLFPQQPQETT